MGELLLCNEAIAAMPYYIEGVSINVYSIEELNYYIINNTYLLDDDFMSLELCTWIENHANLPVLLPYILFALYHFLSHNPFLQIFLIPATARLCKPKLHMLLQ